MNYKTKIRLKAALATILTLAYIIGVIATCTIVGEAHPNWAYALCCAGIIAPLLIYLLYNLFYSFFNN